MQRKIILILGLVLVVYGFITFLFGNLLIGFILLFLSYKKYNPKNWFLAFGFFYLFVEGTYFIANGLPKVMVPYTIIDIFLIVFFLGFYLYLSLNKIGKKKTN